MTPPSHPFSSVRSLPLPNQTTIISMFLPHIPDDADMSEEDVSPIIASPLSPHLLLLEHSLLIRQPVHTPEDDPHDDIYRGVSNQLNMFLRGEYIPLIMESSLPIQSMLSSCSNNSAIESVATLLIDHLQSHTTDSHVRVFECLLVGYSFLELYCQANYTGPELSDSALSPIIGPNDTANDVFEQSLQALECDGTYCYRLCLIPHTLLLSRLILGILAEPHTGCWKRGIYLDDAGTILRPRTLHPMQPHAVSALAAFASIPWLSARSAVVHARLLQLKSFASTPTLWKECSDLFDRAVSAYSNNHSDEDDAARALLLVERGMCEHFFEYGDKGRGHFASAKKAAGLTAELTGSMGRRTKHQQKDFAQLLLHATSSLAASAHIKETNGNEHNAGDLTRRVDMAVKARASEPQQPDTSTGSSAGASSWHHSEWEVGRRVVRETEKGEEAAVREVLLDETDGGAEENIFFEGGPVYSDPLARDGQLHAVDQVIVLALCLDVQNSNAHDGLTTEQMFPYIQRVLLQASNWMVHSTALLQRSWLEFEKRRTADRAMLQIQALLDQHTSKLTLFQSTYKSVQESAPVQERMLYLHSIVYPSQYELKRDLADRYLKFSVYQSALALFRELECWDEVVTCYQLLDKPHRAELVVRERLKHGETPYMLTSLADLTGELEYYERAWTLSRGRYARAKRTLGKICFDKGLYEESIVHLDAALEVQPLVARAWYLKGIACMRLDRYTDAILAFTRCVQQDSEIGEAYANIGAVQMKLNNMSKAYSSLTDAMKVKNDSWMVVENMLTVCLHLGRLKEALMHMNSLLDMRHKSNRPFHIAELRKLTMYVAMQTLKLVQDARREKNELLESEIRDDEMPPLAKEVEAFIFKITNTLKSTAEIWDLFAEFQHLLGRHRRAMDCRYKEVRALSVDPSWAKEAASVELVLVGAEKLAESHLEPVADRTSLHTCVSLIKGLEAQLCIVFEGSSYHSQLKGIACKISSKID